MKASQVYTIGIAISLTLALTGHPVHAVEEGYAILMDREHTEGWVHVGDGEMTIKEGVASSTMPNRGNDHGILRYTPKTFGDFTLKLEFDVDSEATNSGVYLRLPDVTSNPLVSGKNYEVEIFGAKSGELVGGSPQSASALKVGQWNEFEITAAGQHYTVKLNGQIVNDYTGSRTTNGYLGLQNFYGTIKFRNVRIKESPPPAPIVTNGTPKPVATPTPTPLVPAGPLDKVLTGSRWTTTMEIGKYPWGVLTFNSDHEITRMQGRPGAWTATGERSVHFDEFTLTFDPAFRSFTAALADGTKICSGIRQTAPAVVSAASQTAFFDPPATVAPASGASPAMPATPAKPAATPPPIAAAPRTPPPAPATPAPVLALRTEPPALQPARWRARMWDADIIVPAGAYRDGGKPIQLLGGDDRFTVKVRPGVFFDSATFLAEGKHKRWEIEGAFFRGVKLTAMFGTDVSGKDTVFEDCEFEKVGSTYYIGGGSTHWKFENCVFGKNFMRKESIDFVNFAVHATGSTFVRIKLPTIPGPEKMFGKLQTPDMKFERCKFIGCEVPETFLAATVDCVFESCIFPAKRFAWPPGMEPVKVRAFYGAGAVPKAFLNGKLSVDFAAAGKDAVGSTIVFRVDGGRFALASIPQPTTFLQLGSIPKLATEIAEMSAPGAKTSP